MPQEFELSAITDAGSDSGTDTNRKAIDSDSPRSPSLNSARPQMPLPADEPRTPLLTPAQSVEHSAINAGHALFKLDYILLPFLCTLFLLNSLDRSNIGNAETANFTLDAGLEPEDLNTAVALFFVFFVTLQPVGAAIGRKWGMAKYVPTVMAFWGVLTGAHVWVRRRWQLITIRILIGMLEAGFYPTTVSYLSLFYTRFEFAKRLGLFYGQYAISGALGGVLSYVVFKAFPSDQPPPVDTATRVASTGSKWRSWQVLFLIEGGMTMVVALAGFFWLPRGPGSAWFLRVHERQWAERRVLDDRMALSYFEVPEAGDGSVSGNPALPKTGEGRMEGWGGHHRDEDVEEAQRLISEGDSGFEPSSSPGRLGQPRNYSTSNPLEIARAFATDKGLSKRDVVEAVTDWKIWYILVINICSSIPSVAFSVFLPLVVKGLGFESATANLLTVPPFLSGAVALWVFTWWSDKRKERIIPVLWGLFLNLMGLTAVVMLPTTAYLLRYLALCLLLAGTFIASPLTVAWLSGNMEEPGKRAIVLGINGWGNLAGVFSSLIFSPRYAPNYTIPFYITFCTVLFAFFGYALFRWLLVKENASRRMTLEKWSPEEVEMELRYGRGPSVVGRWKASSARYGRPTVVPSGLWTLPLMTRFSDWWGTADGLGEVRRGDEKITFCYGL
ncbi:MAG: hypothetical protein M1839_001987 [Geoglossum umbratile]|nr:MAG: hypothetical protein M1839_001987 [Geoglossum umbratile]